MSRLAQAQDIGRTIRAARLAAGLTQVELARLVGESHSSVISKIESGHLEISLIRAARIAEVCGVPLGALATVDHETRSRLVAHLTAQLTEIQERLRALTEVAR